MTDLDHRESEPALSPRELARLRRRDRKRSTAMVVDNAGVKRILQAQRTREEARRAQQGAGSGAKADSRTGGISHS
ncbi:MAG TPA: hypothetical protein VN193_05835 [Candidatus Angelobacter sp.]|jgi:hypothetical protein|nr:hypothetical protein [Candidatus Angelobacter sp.]